MSIGNGIKLSSGFDLYSKSPLDSRQHFETIAQRDSLAMSLRYDGLMCYVKETDKYYKSYGNNWVSVLENMYFSTISDMNAHPTQDLSIGTECYVVESENQYMWTGSVWRPASTNSVFYGPNAPSDTSAIWIDSIDENIDEILNNDVLEAISAAIQEIALKAEKANYAIEKELDPGYFKGVLPGTDPENPPIPDPDKPDIGDGASGTCNAILVKRGLKEDLTEIKEGEICFCIDTEEFYIGNKGLLRLFAKVGGLGGNSSEGGQNVTGEYIDLISGSSKKFRVTVNPDGKLRVIPSECYTGENANITNSGRYKGLIINQIYGGGARDSNIPPVSHGFIELYNNTDTEFNLKGLSIQYGVYLGAWEVLPLIGIIKPYHSFLIRCAQHTDINRPSTRLKVFDYDMEWNIPLSSDGMKVLLTIGLSASSYTNPANTDGVWTPAPGYIDMIGAGGEDTTRIIDGYEKEYLHCMSQKCGIHRKDFSDTGNNAIDCEPLDYNKVDIKTYAPRWSGTGQWNHYYNKIKMDPYVPTVINIAFGKNGTTERTFTWQTTPTRYGYLKYKKEGESKWMKISSNKKLIQHQDTDVTSHSVILKDLTVGTYIYVVGEEGKWSDEYYLDVKSPSKADRINFIHISDQQGWTEEEYTAWEKAAEFIGRTQEFDFIINSGDISQNGVKNALI